jgi:hypothetical protein
MRLISAGSLVRAQSGPLFRRFQPLPPAPPQTCSTLGKTALEAHSITLSHVFSRHDVQYHKAVSHRAWARSVRSFRVSPFSFAFLIAGRSTPLRRIYPAQPRNGNHSTISRCWRNKVRLRKVTAPGVRLGSYSLGALRRAAIASSLSCSTRRSSRSASLGMTMFAMFTLVT